MRTRVLILICAISSIMSNAQSVPTERELEMIKEINHVRTNPIEYSKFLNAYLDYWGVEDSVKAIAKELIHILQKMRPLRSMQFSKQLHKAAIKHGKWMKEQDSFEHSENDFAENLVSGDSIVRFAVISLLIDDGVPSRGHRLNILNPLFTNVACHEIIGLVDEYNFVFIQEFE